MKKQDLQDSVRTHALRTGMDPSEALHVRGDTPEAAMALVTVRIADEAAAAAGQAGVVKKARSRRVCLRTWQGSVPWFPNGELAA